MLTEVAHLLCMKFKSDYPNIQLLLRRTIQRCKDGDKDKKAVSAAAGAAATAETAGAASKKSITETRDEGPGERLDSAYGSMAGKMRPTAGSGRGSKDQGGGSSRTRLDKIPGKPGVDVDYSPWGRQKSKARGVGGSKNTENGGGRSQVPELPPLARKLDLAGGKERITSGRSGARAAELQAPDQNIRQWMLTRMHKEKEREKLKRRAIEKEIKWIEMMATRQHDRNKANRRLEEMEGAAVVIQGSFRCHKAKKISIAMREEKRRREAEKLASAPTVDEDYDRLFADD